jgi:hypothetical protein
VEVRDRSGLHTSVRRPEQADRWTRLVAAAYVQRRLARGPLAEQRPPWERPLAPEGLTPARLQRKFSTLLLSQGAPAAAPRPCGRSPGRPNGRCSPRGARYLLYMRPVEPRGRAHRARRARMRPDRTVALVAGLTASVRSGPARHLMAKRPDRLPHHIFRGGTNCGNDGPVVPIESDDTFA